MREVKSGAVFARLSKCEEHLNEVLKFKNWGKKVRLKQDQSFQQMLVKQLGSKEASRKNSQLLTWLALLLWKPSSTLTATITILLFSYLVKDTHLKVLSSMECKDCKLDLAG